LLTFSFRESKVFVCAPLASCLSGSLVAQSSVSATYMPGRPGNVTLISSRSCYRWNPQGDNNCSMGSKRPFSKSPSGFGWFPRRLKTRNRNLEEPRAIDQTFAINMCEYRASCNLEWLSQSTAHLICNLDSKAFRD